MYLLFINSLVFTERQSSQTATFSRTQTINYRDVLHYPEMTYSIFLSIHTATFYRIGPYLIGYVIALVTKSLMKKGYKFSRVSIRITESPSVCYSPSVILCRLNQLPLRCGALLFRPLPNGHSHSKPKYNTYFF